MYSGGNWGTPKLFSSLCKCHFVKAFLILFQTYFFNLCKYLIYIISINIKFNWNAHIFKWFYMGGWSRKSSLKYAPCNLNNHLPWYRFILELRTCFSCQTINITYLYNIWFPAQKPISNLQAILVLIMFVCQK